MHLWVGAVGGKRAFYKKNGQNGQKSHRFILGISIILRHKRKLIINHITSSMKKSFSVLSLGLLLGMTAISCNSDDLLDSSNLKEIKLISNIQLTHETRGANLNEQATDIAAGQQIGVTITGAKTAHTNVAWTADGVGQLSNTGDPIYYGNGTAVISAYHPYNSAWDGFTTGAALDFSVATDQTGAGYKNSDLLYASTSSPSTDLAVNLTFSHILSKISVVLTASDETDLSTAVISIANTATKAVFQNGVATSTGEDIADIKAGVGAQATAIIVPQTVASGTKIIKIAYEGNTYTFTLPTDKTFKAGNSYTYNLAFSAKNSELFLKNAVVNAWNNNEIDGAIDSGDEGAENPGEGVTLLIPGPDFNTAIQEMVNTYNGNVCNGLSFKTGAVQLPSTTYTIVSTDDSEIKAYACLTNEGTVEVCSSAATFMANPNASYMFSSNKFKNYNFDVNLKHLDTSNVTNMDYMFYYTRQETIELNSLNTSNVSSMQHTFERANFKTIDITGWDMSNVLSTNYMFASTSNEQEGSMINLENLDISKAKSMDYMFQGCGARTLILDNVNASSATVMRSFFQNARARNISLHNFDTRNAEDMDGFFREISNMTTIDLSTFNTQNATALSHMFCGSSFTSLDLSHFKTASAVTMFHMFIGCSKLKSINLSGWDTRSLQVAWNMFNGCSALETLDVSSFRTPLLNNMDGMFCGLTSLSSLDISSFDLTNATKMNYTFAGCTNLKSIRLPVSASNKISEFSQTFSGCEKLTSFNIEDLNMNEARNLSETFKNCSSITTLNLGHVNTSHATTMNNMFSGCSALENLNIANFVTSNVTDFSSMFQGCFSLRSLDVSSFRTTKAINMNSMFKGCTLLSSLDVSSFDTSSANNMTSMFQGCSKLESLNLGLNFKFSSFNFDFYLTNMLYLVGSELPDNQTCCISCSDATQSKLMTVDNNNFITNYDPQRISWNILSQN